MEQCTKNLYIPIWLYSNLVSSSATSFISSFTFQSGYIQISLKPEYDRGLFGFTFQSGYIQIGKENVISAYVHTLHSNLVIFK